MKSKILSLFAFAFLFFSQITASECCAQEQYFRYFEVHSPSLSDADLNSIKSKLEKQEFMAVYATCPSTNKLLIAVDASYPKRIDDIEMELSDLVLGKNARKKESAHIRMIPASERNQICQ